MMIGAIEELKSLGCGVKSLARIIHTKQKKKRSVHKWIRFVFYVYYLKV